jgi:hypothetical protein
MEALPPIASNDPQTHVKFESSYYRFERTPRA